MKNSRREFFGKAAAVAAAASVSPLASFGRPMENAIENQSQLSAPTDLRITEVQIGYVGGRLFVKLRTNQDIYGVGEAVDAVGGTYFMAENIGRRMVSQNFSPLNIYSFFESTRKSAVFGGGQSAIYIAVLSAFEIALWDLVGKVYGMPVYQLMGGKMRDKIAVYCDTALYRSNNPEPKDFVEAAADAVKNWGFFALKFDIDQAGDPNRIDRVNWTASPGEVQRMYDQLSAVREALGPNIHLCVDMHARYDYPTAQAVAKKVEPLNLTWLEEPVPAEDPHAYAKVARETSTPIAGGENFYLIYAFKQLLELGGLDIVMPDLQKCGGLGEGQRIANMAHAYYVPFSPHMVASFLGCMASAHVCASVPNFHLLEWQSYFETDASHKEIVIYDEECWPKNGYLTLSNKPGIGVDINVEVMKSRVRGDVPFTLT